MTADGGGEVDDGILEEFLVTTEEVLEVPVDLELVIKAAEEGNIGALRDALGELVTSIDHPGEDGDTALHLACLYGHQEAVEILLTAGASVDVRDEDGALPLHDASAGGYNGIVTLLLQAAEEKHMLPSLLSLVDVDGDTPLHHAGRGCHAQVVRLLLDAGFSPQHKNLAEMTPAMLADVGTEAHTLLQSSAHQEQQLTNLCLPGVC